MARDPETAKNRPNHSGRERETRGEENPGSNLAGRNPTAEHPGKEGGGNLRTPEMRTTGNPNPNRQTGLMHNEMTFACADVGHDKCNWTVRGRSEEELMPQIERHGREQHGITDFDNNLRNQVRSAIHRRAA